jgi:hypothetical protein
MVQHPKVQELPSETGDGAFPFVATFSGVELDRK